MEAGNAVLKAGLAALEARHKAWLKLLDMADKQLRSRQWTSAGYTFAYEDCREAKKALHHRDVKKREQPTVRDLAVEAFKRASSSAAFNANICDLQDFLYPEAANRKREKSPVRKNRGKEPSWAHFSKIHLALASHASTKTVGQNRYV